MIKETLLVAIALLACAPASFGADIPEMMPERWFDPASPCDEKHDERTFMTCEEDRAKFATELQVAFRGNYTAQRNLASYYATGSDGAVYQNPEMACAWSMVIVVSTPPESHEYSGGTPLDDVRDLLRYCGPLEDSGDHFQAKVVAERILSRLDPLSIPEQEALRDKLDPPSTPAPCVATNTCPEFEVKPFFQ